MFFSFSDIECHRHPCMHGGICTDDQMSGHTCHCPLGFTGLNCEIGIYTLPAGHMQTVHGRGSGA